MSNGVFDVAEDMLRSIGKDFVELPVILQDCSIVIKRTSKNEFEVRLNNLEIQGKTKTELVKIKIDDTLTVNIPAVISKVRLTT